MPATQATTIVALGDSTTAERGALEVFAALLQNELSPENGALRVINAGVPSNTTEDARERLERDVLAHRPDLVIIQFGLNDSAVDVWKSPPANSPRISLERYRENLRHLIEQCQKAGARVILMTPNSMQWTPGLVEQYGKAPYQPENLDGLNVVLRDYVEVVRQVAAAMKVELVDVFARYDQARPDEILLMDGMHPNENGHRLVADLLKSHLQKSPANLPSRSTQP